MTTVTEARWPNAGYLWVSGRKKIAYDELSLPEWVVGQLYNVFHIQDPDVAKHALLHVILALKDATSLHVRSSWMHKVEQGINSWEDSIQWLLNRLSASQVAKASSRIVNEQ